MHYHILHNIYADICTKHKRKEYTYIETQVHNIKIIFHLNCGDYSEICGKSFDIGVYSSSIIHIYTYSRVKSTLIHRSSDELKLHRRARSSESCARGDRRHFITHNYYLRLN